AVVMPLGLAGGWLVTRRGPALRSAIYRATLVAVLVSPFATWLISSLGLTAAINLPTFRPVVVQAAPAVSAASSPKSNVAASSVTPSPDSHQEPADFAATLGPGTF